MQKTVCFTTLGCKVNQYDSQAMLEEFERHGYAVAPAGAPADVCVVNTCTVTGTGDKKSLQAIRRCRRRNPGAELVVTGCLAQRMGEALRETGARLILGTQYRARVVELLEQAVREGMQMVAVEGVSNAPYEPLSIHSHEGHTRAVMKIQEGCDRYCTYCIIPYARGPLRSRTPENIRKNLLLLAEHGYKEVVMTGIHLMSYGKDMDWKVDLTDAIAQADGIDEIQRIRLGSLEPQLLTEKFVSALSSNPKICRQFHLSMQSGSDGVLKRMNRRYDTAVYERCVEMLRETMPGCAITTDVIAGFPGESEREFQETKEFIRRIKLARIHVFPYSRREGTAAYSMPNQIPNAEKSRRAGELIHIGAELEREYLQNFLGTVQEVLLEEPEQGLMSGYTDTYARVSVEGADEGMAGQMVKVLIKEAAEDRLLGRLVI